MSKNPKIAIVGRPNVGKSALFNRICKKRIAIVDEAEGVTRDRLYAQAECFGRTFDVIDTGGIDARSTAQFNEEVLRQAQIAIEEADSLILVVDSHVGATALDLEVARLLSQKGKPLCVAVNKVDRLEDEVYLHQFHSLGIPHLFPVSAAHGLGLAELLEYATSALPPISEEEEDLGVKVAIIGRPNVGKSTLVNHLLEEKRCCVSPIAGTTRDSVDIPMEWDERPYTLIDTAGIRRKKSEKEVVDKFAFIRTERSIERADICLLMLDVQEGFTAQDKKILNKIEEEGKACILLLNKWDLVHGFRMEHVLSAMQQEAPFIQHCPVYFISATEGRNTDKIFQWIDETYRETSKRISTGELNRFIEQTMHAVHPPMIRGKRLRIYYMTQVDTCPPRFILFINYPYLMEGSYKRYLLNNFRKAFGFQGVPIQWHLKGKVVKANQPTSAQ